MLNLQSEMIETKENSEPLEGAEVAEVIEMTISGSVATKGNSDYREYSKNL